MPFYGLIVVIKRSGADGSTFPLVNDECLIGRGEGCDIRIQLPIVSKEQSEDGTVQIIPMSKTNNTKLNGIIMKNDIPVTLVQEDVFNIGDRSFRWLYPNGCELTTVKRPTTAAVSSKPSSPSEVIKRILPEAELEAEDLGTFSKRKRASNADETVDPENDFELKMKNYIAKKITEDIFNKIDKKLDTLTKLIVSKNNDVAKPECPICYGEITCETKIAQCISGHYLCWDCKRMLSDNQCPSCSLPVDGRAFGMENYLKTLFK